MRKITIEEAKSLYEAYRKYVSIPKTQDCDFIGKEKAYGGNNKEHKAGVHANAHK